jgi:hypothetical protein
MIKLLRGSHLGSLGALLQSIPPRRKPRGTGGRSPGADSQGGHRELDH